MDASGEAKRYVVLEVYEFSILNSQFSIDGKASRESESIKEKQNLT